MTFLKILAFLAARLVEPSTGAGIAALALGGHELATGNLLSGIAALAGGLHAVLTPAAGGQTK